MDFRALALRLGMLGSALGALAEPRLSPGPLPAGPLEVRDVSASLGPGADPSAPTDGLGAPQTWIAVADGHRWLQGGAPLDGLARGASAVGAALADAAERLPGRDVLVVSDGRFTDDAAAGARAVRARGGRVHVRLPGRPAADVGLAQARGQRSAAGVEIEALVEASAEGVVRVGLWRGATEVAAQSLRVVPGGRQRVQLLDPEPPAEGGAYRVQLVAAPGTPDDDPGNDALVLGVSAERGTVLWCGPDAPDPGALGAVGLRVSPGLDLEAAAAAEAVVLADLPYEAIGPAGVDGLRLLVAGGARLLVLGGPRAYAAGGYAGTPLEDLLPLHVPAPEGDAVWVVALDASGSTRGPPLAALVAALAELLPALRPGERLAVLPFAARAASAPLGPGFVAAGDAEAEAALLRALAGLVAAGPTDLAAGVAGALDLLATQPGRGARSLLLVTDGDPDEAPDREALRALLPRLSALDVRFGALVIDMPRAVEALRATLARRPEDVQILASGRDASRALLARLSERRAEIERERAGRPERVEAAPGSWAAGLFAGWVPGATHVTALSPASRLLARALGGGAAPGEWPLAAERDLGAGVVRALAWGPGLEVPRGLHREALVPTLAEQARQADRGDAADLDEAGHLLVRLPAHAGAGRLSWVGGDAEGALLEVQPGLFRSEAPAPPEGPLRARPPPPAPERVLRLPARPRPEHRGVGPDRAALLALAEVGGGRLLAPGEAAPRGGREPGPSAAPWLLVLACILLVLERAHALRARRSAQAGSGAA